MTQENTAISLDLPIVLYARLRWGKRLGVGLGLSVLWFWCNDNVIVKGDPSNIFPAAMEGGGEALVVSVFSLRGNGMNA